MGKFVITEEEKKHIMGLYEQGQPVDINYIISQSDNDKGVDTFCKAESGYDICLMEKSMDKEVYYESMVRRNPWFKVVDIQWLRNRG